MAAQARHDPARITARAALKQALIGTPLYPLAKGLYRHTLQRRYLAARGRLMAFYARLVQRGQLVFDVGANHGDFADAFLHLGARVVAVEPHPDCARELRSLYGGSRRFTLAECALGSEIGEAPLFLGENGMDNVSTLSEDYRREASKLPGLAVAGWNRSVLVRVDTLDRLIARHGIPDFCKIDVEGYEIEVLRGLRSPLPLLQFEYQPWSVEKAIECVDRLLTLGPYRFNLTASSDRDDAVALRPEWLDADGIKLLLRGSVAEARRVGDVFARHDPTEQRRLARPAGIEPATPAFGGQYSIH